jgi:hypothetical protein
MNRSGQMLLLAVLILVILVVSIPALIFLNQHAVSHGIISQKRLRGRAIAEEGAAFAIQQLSSTTASGLPSNWPFLNGTSPATIPAALNFNGTTNFPSSQGEGSYKITCNLPPTSGLQSYQVQVVAVPYDTQGNVISGSSLASIVSRRTVGAKLPTGLSASAALDMAQAPTIGANAQLDVELGPIICRNNDGVTAGWVLDTITGPNRRPRKFSTGQIYPRCTSPTSITTDQKEYWAYTSPGFAFVINLSSYQYAAQNSVCGTGPYCKRAQGSCSNAYPTEYSATSCYYSIGTDTAVFNGNTLYNSPATNSVIYVDGNAEFDTVTVNVSSAVIIANALAGPGNGNLTLGYGTTGGPFINAAVRYPPTAALENPYSTCGAPPSPCSNGVTTNHLDIQGFVYVQGNLVVFAAQTWTLDGAVRVDGATTVNSNATMLILYNDVTSRAIQTSNFELQVDSTTAIP